MLKNTQTKSSKDLVLTFSKDSFYNQNQQTYLAKKLNSSKNLSNTYKNVNGSLERFFPAHNLKSNYTPLTSLKPTNLNNLATCSQQPKKHKILSRNKLIGTGKFNQEFKVGKVLGKGRFGNVCIAKNIATNSIYAVKKIGLQKMSKKLLERIIAEIKIQYFLKHQNCLQLYKFYKEDNEIILILEVGEQSLFDLLRKNRFFSERKTAYYVRQTINALIYLHYNGVIHRDIKPENIVIVNNMVKLADFGWSVYTGNNKRNTFCGTLDYVCPEIVLGSEYDQMVDVWSVGVLCYELCTGHAPFESKKSRQETYQNILRGQVKFPLHISKQLEDFMRRLLVRDPKMRMALRQSLMHPFMRMYDQSDRCLKVQI